MAILEHAVEGGDGHACFVLGQLSMNGSIGFGDKSETVKPNKYEFCFVAVCVVTVFFLISIVICAC